MVEKFLKLTPKSSKLFPIYDISGETIFNNITGVVQLSYICKGPRFKLLPFFSVPKITPRNTPETRKPLYLQQVSQKINF